MTIPPIVVMGVAGCGKSSLGQALADRLQVAFIEGDDLHPAANIRKMAAGIPLDDNDRAPFLDAVANALGACLPKGGVASCSALKRRYRNRIRDIIKEPVLFVMADLTRDELSRRIANRPGHFMPPSMLDSQLATLEPLGDDEWSFRVDGMLPLVEQSAEIAALLSAAA
jgi:carbohydrate kinase (thermoresistant glucokinase family)